jgi:hypothetical protein
MMSLYGCLDRINYRIYASSFIFGIWDFQKMDHFSLLRVVCKLLEGMP